MAQKQHQRRNGKGSQRKQEKKTHQFSSGSVLSPHNTCTFVPRTTVQRTPRKLCTLALPPPLPTLFEDPTSTPAKDATAEATSPSPNPRHHRTPSDFTGISIDPSQLTESSHHTQRHHYPSGTTSELPAHLRIGMACDPLIAYGLVLVATIDGRVAIYQIANWEKEVDEDVAASQERRRKEWEEEDVECAGTANTEDEEKKSSEDSFWEEEYVMERMSARERGRECVDPLLVVSLPDKSGVEMKESINFPPSLPMIVGMCATPLGTSLIQHRGDDADKLNSERLMGHVAVLTDDGGVHILELLSNPFLSSDSEIVEAAIKLLSCTKDVVSVHQFAPNVNVVFSFHTGSLGATCICMQPIFGDARVLQNIESEKCYVDRRVESEKIESHNESTRHPSKMRLCIGHECGILECYQVYSTLTSMSQCNISSPYPLAKSKSNEIPRSGSNSNLSRGTPKRNSNTTSFSSANLSVNPEEDGTEDGFDLASVDTSPTRLIRTLSEPTDQLLLAATMFASKKNQQPSDSAARIRPVINAELCWRGSMNVPIRSVACPGWSDSLTNNRSSSLVALGLMQCQKESNLIDTNRKCNYQEVSPAISLEVIDAALTEEYWSQIKECIVPLNQCSVWPAAGMEIKDGWTRSDGHYCYETVSQALGLRSVSITNKMCHFARGSPCFATAASDGTVAISHLNQDGTWGVHHDYNQLMLPRRCIGMGVIEYTSSTKPERYICCCLRGGTMYLVPVIGNSKDIATGVEREITKFLVPVDPSGEDVVRYVQNFSSGLIQTLQRNTNHTTSSDSSLKSVALVGWNGGIIDVYDISTGENHHDKELFQQLVDRGLASRLVERLLIVNRSHPMIASLVWREAWDECNRAKDLESILAGIKIVSKSNFTSTRALLMGLAEDSI